jgi:HEPN domain-containing protein
MTAEHTLQLTVDCPFEIVSFHAQQCAEKYLKAFLVARRIDFIRTHDLRYLVELASEQVELDLDPFDVAILNRYAVEGRYPDAWDEITRGDAEEAVAMARQVRTAIRAHLPP